MSSKKIINVRHKRIECIGCAWCAEVAPDCFTMDEDGLATGINTLIPPALRGEHHYLGFSNMDRCALEEAAEGCPVQIIQLDD